MEDAAKGKPLSRDTTARVQLVTQETRENVLFECRDRKALASAYVHRSYLTKDEPSEPGQASQAGYPGRAHQNLINAPADQQNQTDQVQQQVPQTQPAPRRQEGCP